METDPTTAYCLLPTPALSKPPLPVRQGQTFAASNLQAGTDFLLPCLFDMVAPIAYVDRDAHTPPHYCAFTFSSTLFSMPVVPALCTLCLFCVPSLFFFYYYNMCFLHSPPYFLYFVVVV